MQGEPRQVVRRARRDIRANRLWKARDRLASAVHVAPHDQAILQTLGEVYYAMGDQPAAWRYWILTERRDAEADVARAAFEERFGRSGVADQLRQIPAREPLDAYPAVVRRDLLELRARARDRKGDWPPAARAPGRDVHGESGRFAWLPGAAIVLLFVAPWLAGAGLLLYLIGRALVEACTG